MFTRDAGIILVHNDDGNGSNLLDSLRTPGDNTADEEATVLLKAETSCCDTGLREGISYLPVPAPRWCSFDSEASYTAPQ